MKTRKITIRTTQGPKKINAWVYGNWAIHRRLPTKTGIEGIWMSVTHVATGLCLDSVAGGLDRRDAVTIVRALAVVPEFGVVESFPASLAMKEDWGYVILSIVGEVLGG